MANVAERLVSRIRQESKTRNLLEGYSGVKILSLKPEGFYGIVNDYTRVSDNFFPSTRLSQIAALDPGLDVKRFRAEETKEFLGSGNAFIDFVAIDRTHLDPMAAVELGKILTDPEGNDFVLPLYPVKNSLFRATVQEEKDGKRSIKTYTLVGLTGIIAPGFTSKSTFSEADGRLRLLAAEPQEDRFTLVYKDFELPEANTLF